MVKIQINLSKAEDKVVGVYRIVKELQTKEEAIKEIIKEYGSSLVKVGK